MTPFPYQIDGAAFLASRKRALLADDMGLGKSAQAILAAKEVNAFMVVVVCPASVVQNWHREIERFWPELAKRRTYNVVSYDYMTRNVENTDWFGSNPDSVLILDEAHYLKTRDAKRTKAIFGPKCDGAGGLVERARYVFLLTGTPAPNHAAELWPMLRAVMPESIATATGRPMAYWTFVSRYCRTTDNGFGLKIVGGKNLDKLKAALAPHMMRRKKEEVLKDLPPIRFDTLAVEGKLTLPQDCADEVRLVYETVEKKGIDGLREIAPHVAKLRRLTGLAKVQSCVDWIKDWLEAGGKKLVVFAHHRDVIDGIFFGLREAKVLALKLDGSMGQTWRQQVIDNFQEPDGASVFIGQIQAAGTGITLTAASDALFVESSWVPAENEQAAMRIHRIGQKNACLVRFAALAGSIDEDIQRAVMRKTADIAKLFS